MFGHLVSRGDARVGVVRSRETYLFRSQFGKNTEPDDDVRLKVFDHRLNASFINFVALVFDRRVLSSILVSLSWSAVSLPALQEKDAIIKDKDATIKHQSDEIYERSI